MVGDGQVVVSMELVAPSQETLGKILLGLNTTVELHRKDTETLKTWLRSQPHLPHDLEDALLGSFIVGCKNSLERAKQKLEGYLCNRTLCPDFYQHRDPCDPAFRRSSRIMRHFPLPHMTPEGHRITIFSLSSPDVTPEDIDLRLIFNKVLSSIDVRFLEEQFWAGEVLIIDCRHYTLKLLPALAVPSVLKDFIHCHNNGVPLKVKKIIFINLVPVVDIVLSVVKPLIKQKIAKRFITTTDDHTYLYDHVPKDLLPDEYGGTAGTLDQLNDAWQRKVESYREWFLQDAERKVEERLRPDKTRYKPKVEMFGIEGSFKTLTID